MYAKLLIFAIASNAPEFAVYAMRSLPPDDTKFINESVLIRTSNMINPSDPSIENNQAMMMENPELAKRLLADPRMTPGTEISKKEDD